jgi:uncharacterized membrane protein
MRIVMYSIAIIAFLLVTFFGLGPVLLADGTRSERIVTLIVVILLYLPIGGFVLRIKKQWNENKKIKVTFKDYVAKNKGQVDSDADFEQM